MAEQYSSHKDSIAWQKGMALAETIYKVTRDFPKDERFGLTNQLRRAAVSIPSNIAEGRGRLNKGEFLQHLGIARGSLLELETQLELAFKLSFGTKQEIQHALSLVSEETRILNASIATLRSQLAAKKK